MKSSKIRFGVSLEARLAEDIERMAIAMGTNRSHIVSIAVRRFLDENHHFISPHECEGIVIISYEPEKSEEIDPEIENRKESIRSRLHLHTSEGLCIEVLYVKAHSNDILELESSMTRCGCKAFKFIPCHS